MSALGSRTVETPRGAKIRVYEAGSGDPLVFLHGAGGLLPDDPFVVKLAERFHVFAPCLPGYEDSTGEEDLRDMLGITLHTADVVEALGLERPTLVGHSMGGMIAAEMAAVAPASVERLVLICPAGLWDDEQPIADLFGTLPFELPALLFHDPEVGAALLTAGLDFTDMGALADFMVTNSKRLGMAGKILFPIPDRGLSERLYRIQARTLILWGESDKLIPPSYGNAFQAAIAGSELRTIAEAGHMLPIEQPQAVLEAIASL
ncbi:MAG: alpha/beta hydrolase [Deltaproteobacteria bacterium]|nr:alpha/beta hydrolase [Deltaproteobacteria bacterium]MBW2415753.1 alpha/beta hydrolase [Deltaproteobacteria bacterium]